jgi:hypothetical protein
MSGDLQPVARRAGALITLATGLQPDADGNLDGDVNVTDNDRRLTRIAIISSM